MFDIHKVSARRQRSGNGRLATCVNAPTERRTCAEKHLESINWKYEELEDEGRRQ